MVHSLASHVADDLVLSAESNVIRDTLQEGTLGLNTGSIYINGSEVIDSTQNWVGSNLDHTSDLDNVGTNTHAQIDTHMADGTKHFTEGSIDHTVITNVGNNTHTQIDTHITNVSNPHSVDKTDVGLSNVTNDAQLPLAGGTLTGNLTINSTATSGNSLSITRDLASGSTDSAVASIIQDNSSDDQYALYIRQDGAAVGLKVLLSKDTPNPAIRVDETSQGSTTNQISMCYGASSQRRTIQIYRNLSSAYTGKPVAEIVQDNSGDDQVALYIRQDAVAEGFINFVGSNRGIITGATNSTESVRIEINGAVRRIALFADA